MAKRTKTKNLNAIAWNNAIESEKKIAKLYLAACEKGLIDKDKVSKGVKESAAAFIKTSGFFSKTDVVSNSAGDVSKTVGMMSSGVPHSPIREMNDTSRRQRHISVLADVIKLIADYYGKKDLHTYMITLTRPRVRMGHLNDAYLEEKKFLNAFHKALINGKARKSGLRFVGNYGKECEWLGSYYALENTLDPDCMICKRDYVNGNALFHPHVHLILITNGSADVEATKSLIFKMWTKYISDKCSPDATFMEEAYSNDETSKFKKPFIEATKYDTKPDFYNHLSVGSNDTNDASDNNSDDDSNNYDFINSFDLAVFSEMHNAKYRKQMKVCRGIVATADKFLNFLGNRGLGNALMNASSIYESLSNANVPEVLSIRSELNSVGFHNSQPLNDSQLLYFNESLLKKITFDSSLLKLVNFKDDKMSDLYKYLLSSFTFVEPTTSAINNHFDYYVAICRNRINAIDSIFANDYDNSISQKESSELSDLRQHWKFKLADCERLASAVSTHLVDGVIKTFNYSKLARLSNMFKYLHEQLGDDGDIEDYYMPDLVDFFGPNYVFFGDYFSQDTVKFDNKFDAIISYYRVFADNNFDDSLVWSGQILKMVSDEFKRYLFPNVDKYEIVVNSLVNSRDKLQGVVNKI